MNVEYLVKLQNNDIFVKKLQDLLPNNPITQ